MKSLWNDTRVGLRTVAKHPFFSGIAILVLGIGIGANSTIFSLINSVALGGWGLEAPEELVSVFNRSTEAEGGYRAFSYPNFVDIRERNDVFQDVAAFGMSMVGLAEGEETRRAFVTSVSANYFRTLGVDLMMGRAFTEQEEKSPTPERVAIMSHGYWSRLGSPLDVLGRTVRVNAQSFTVIGVTPDSFTGINKVIQPDLFFPLSVHNNLANDFGGSSVRTLDDRDNHNLMLIARLDTRVEEAKRETQLVGLSTQMGREFPDINQDFIITTGKMSSFAVSTAPLDDSILRLIVVILMGMSGIVLLIACLNLGHMQVARGEARAREFALRRALGGSRSRLVKQLLVEGFLIALGGGLVGLAAAFIAPRILLASIRQVVPMNLNFEVRPDILVVLVTLGFCCLSTLLFALRPALRLTRGGLYEELKAQRGDSEGRAPLGFWSGRNIPVISEIALSLALVIVAGLFIRGVYEAAGVDPGFESEGVAVLETDLSMLGLQEEQGRRTYLQLLEHLRAMPELAEASLTSMLPFGNFQTTRGVREAGAPSNGEDSTPVTAGFNIVGQGYFNALGIPVLDGRDFTRREELTDRSVAVIDKLLADRLWPGQRAIGKRITFLLKDFDRRAEMEVIGVVGDVQSDFFGSRRTPQLYLSIASSYQSLSNLIVKFRGQVSPATLASIRSRAKEVDPQLPVLSLKTLENHLETSIPYWVIKTAAVIFSCLGGLALMMAVVGVYGIRAYSVVRRTREIGIRMALGASIENTVWMVLKEGLRMTVVGGALGVILALGMGRVVGTILYRVGDSDWIVLVSGTLLVTGAMMLACWIPARRAARVDPMVSLRYE